MLATVWSWDDPSLHFVGAWYRVGPDGLSPDPARPARKRPLLHSFAAERSRAPGFLVLATAWLRPAKARPILGPDLRLGDARPRQRGRITGVTSRPDGSWVLAFAPAGGGATRQVLLGPNAGPREAESVVIPDGLVDRRRVMPFGYVPSDPVAAWNDRLAALDDRPASIVLGLE